MRDDFVTLSWTQHGTIRLIDQTRLPMEEVYVECGTVEEVARAIRTMQVRGAPAIGIAAAMGLAMGARTFQTSAFPVFYAALEAMAAQLVRTRPTAVNLAWAVRRMVHVAQAHRELPTAAIAARLMAEATAMREEDIRINRAIGAHGQTLVPDPARILTHCNAGGLATAGYGTAIGVIRAAVEAGKRVRVWVDETRPLLQGARLTACRRGRVSSTHTRTRLPASTAWELTRAGIPATLITDNMAGHFMQRGEVDIVVVGADRIARNGDTANKIGTYSVAVLARAHGIPFFVAAPISTLDLSLNGGSEIPIEERAPEEVTEIGGRRLAPNGMRAANPAFDVTPASYLDGIITERGIARAPYEESLPRLAGEA
jgi:methylthioribose-1-phosphate isomerase